MARFGVVTSFLRPRGWTPAAAEGTASLVAPRWRIAWPSWSPLWRWLKDWTETDATYFLLSAVIHMTIFVLLALLPMHGMHSPTYDAPPEFTPPEVPVDDRPELIHIKFDDASLDQPGDISDHALSHPEDFGSPTEFNDNSKDFVPGGGGGRKPTAEGAPYDGRGRPDLWGVGIGPRIHGRDGMGAVRARATCPCGAETVTVLEAEAKAVMPAPAEPARRNSRWSRRWIGSTVTR